jgi:hypothetical protein
MVANWLKRCGGVVDDAQVDGLADEVETLRAAAFAGV